MSAGEIVLLIVYVIGVLVIINFQKEKIGALNAQIKAQNDMIANMQRLMSIIKLDDIEKYVDINKKIMEHEKEEAVKNVEKKIKAKADDALKLLLQEYSAVYGLALRIIGVYPHLDKMSTYISEIDTNIGSREHLLSFLAKSQSNWEKTRKDIFAYFYSEAYQSAISGKSASPDATKKKLA